MLRHALLWLLLGATSGCVKAGTAPVGDAPRTSKLATASLSRTTRASGEPFQGPVGEQVAEGVRLAAEQHAPALVGDARLGALAAWTAAFWGVHGRFPTTAAIDYEAHRVGLVEPVPSVGLMGTDDDPQLPERVAEQVGIMLSRGQYTHIGAASERSGDKLRIVLVMSARPVDLIPFAASPKTGTELRLSGALTHGYRAPELLVVAPDGQSTRRRLGEGTDLDTRVALDAVGAYQVELLAEGPHGITVVANFPVYSGVAPPAPPDPLPMTHGEAGSPEAMRSAMLELVNATRTDTGVPPLQPDGRLEAVAAAHNLDMRDHGYVGHTSARTGKPEDRVRGAGIVSPIVAENVGRGYSLEEIHAGLLASPGHRENLMHPRVTHVGIDVLATPQVDRNEFLVTEVFIRVIPTLQDGDAARLLTLINARREASGLRPLAIDATLAELSARAATRHFDAGMTPEANMGKLKADRKGRYLPYAGLSQTLSVVSALEDIAGLAPLLDPEAKAVGLGLAQGDLPDSVPNAIVGVVLVAY